MLEGTLRIISFQSLPWALEQVAQSPDFGMASPILKGELMANLLNFGTSIIFYQSSHPPWIVLQWKYILLCTPFSSKSYLVQVCWKTRWGTGNFKLRLFQDWFCIS